MGHARPRSRARAVQRSRGLLVVLCLVMWLGTVAGAQQASPEGVVLTPDEIALAHEFSPLPDPPVDPTNAVADDPRAALLGQALFFDARLSGNGEVSCATCHDPAQGFGDGRALGRGVADLTRHSMTLWNVAYNRWFFWDGRKDSLWSQALAPFEDEREHATSRLAIAHLVADDPSYARAYEALFGALPALDDGLRFPLEGRPVPGHPEHAHARAWDGMATDDRTAVDRLFVNLGKAIAAYERRLVSRRAAFDVFVEGLGEGDGDKLAALPASAQRGFALFAGKGQCLLCHDGPNFSDGEFHTNRIPATDVPDDGRYLGMQQALVDPFNLRSAFADDGGARGLTRLGIAPLEPHVPADFKTPTLRNVAVTAPYMHDGRMANLDEVLAFYSTLEGAARPVSGGERLIDERNFDAQQLADLKAFLESLTDERVPAELLSAPASLEPSGEGG